MDFITLGDITDEILQVTGDDVAVANEYINGLVTRFRINSAALMTPPSYVTRRIAICYACYVRAINLVGSDAMASYDGADGKDVFAQKAKFYKQELDSLVNNLTSIDFTGEGVSGSITVNVFRA